MASSAPVSDNPPAPVRRRTPPLVLVAYVGVAAALLFAALRGSLPLVGTTFPGFFVLDNGILAAVYARDWTGVQAGLPFDGAVVTRVAGAPFAGGRALLAEAARHPAGTPIDYTILRRGETREFVVPTMPFTRGAFVASLGGYLFLAAVLLGIGAIALGLRPDLPAARALAATLGSVGALFALAVDHLTSYRLVPLYHLCEALAPAAILNLALVFPRARLTTRRRHALIGGATALLVAGAIAETITFHERPDLAWRWDAAIYVLMALLGLALVVSFGVSLARGRDPSERTRAALVFTGGLVGFLLPAAALLSFFVLGVEVPTTWWTPFLAAFALFLLYAIVKHDLLGAERVVRLGVGYVLASATMLVVYSASLALLTRFVWTRAEQSPLPSFALVLAVALSFEPLRRRVQTGIDRVFYRSRLDLGAALETSSGDLATLGEEGEIVRYVESLLGEMLGVEWARAALTPDRDARTGAALEETVRFRGERLGWIACGPKRSGAPFSGAERDLLRGVAAQTALAVHNARVLCDLRAAQERLLRAERLAAVGEFAGAVAHGIRNPLAGIRAAAQVAHLRGQRGEIASESLANVLAESDRLDHRIRSLLDFSRPYQLRPQRIDLVPLLEAVRRSLAGRPGAYAVSIACEADAVEVEADSAYLEEALLELGANALRAMPEGGALAIEVRAEGGVATLRFRDTGGGIPEGVRQRLFDLFFTTRPDGTGIGLPTVKKIIELHGGTIELEHSGPDGTVFRITLSHAG
jgi:signal transduction histidine kinase